MTDQDNEHRKYRRLLRKRDIYSKALSAYRYKVLRQKSILRNLVTENAVMAVLYVISSLLYMFFFVNNDTFYSDLLTFTYYVSFFLVVIFLYSGIKKINKGIEIFNKNIKKHSYVKEKLAKTNIKIKKYF